MIPVYPPNSNPQLAYHQYHGNPYYFNQPTNQPLVYPPFNPVQQNNPLPQPAIQTPLAQNQNQIQAAKPLQKKPLSTGTSEPTTILQTSFNTSMISNSINSSEPPTVVKGSKLQNAFKFVFNQFSSEITKIEYWNGIKIYKLKDDSFNQTKKKKEFIEQLNNNIKMKNWPSLLNIILQKSHQVAMELTSKDNRFINFMIQDQQLIRIEATYNNKKEANKLASLVILRLLAKKIYSKCERNEEFSLDDFGSNNEENDD